MDVRDQYGNAVGMLDEYGNPVPVEAYAHPTGYGGQNQPKGTDSGEGLRKSGSSSSSSSEDDGMGGRRKKKGLKEKIKEKLPGGHKKDADPEGATPHVEEPHEKKGLMEKIKEKLPGGHH